MQKYADTSTGVHSQQESLQVLVVFLTISTVTNTLSLFVKSFLILYSNISIFQFNNLSLDIE